MHPHVCGLVTHVNDSGGGRVFTAVCLFVLFFLFQTIFQNDAAIGSPNLIYKCSTMSSGNPFILRSMGQRSRSPVNMSVLVFIQNAILPLAAYVSHAGFSLRHFPKAAAAAVPRDINRARQTVGFSVRGISCSYGTNRRSQQQKTSPAWFFAFF